MNYLFDLETKTHKIYDTDELLKMQDFKNKILIIDCEEDYQMLKSVPGLAITGLERDGMRLGCRYIFEDEADITFAALEKIYKRFHKIPLKIAETARCIIREFGKEGDLDLLFEMYKTPGFTDFMENLFEYEEEKAYQENYRKYIYEFYDYGMWLVFDKATGKLAGRIGFEYRDSCREGQAELGYSINGPFQNKGYATEVCQKMIELAKAYELKSLIARVNPDNTPSRKLAEKLGMKKVGGYDEFLSPGEVMYEIVL